MSAATFLVLAAVSLGASAILIVRIERLGHRFGVTEAVLGLAAALAADAPEVTTAVSALVRGQRDVGVGVVLGANVFQLAALLGLGAVVATGGLSLDRRVIAFEGFAAAWLALMALAVVGGGLPGWGGLVLALAVFVPYVIVSAMSPQARARLPLPPRFREEVDEAIEDEEEAIAEVVAELPSSRWDAPVAIGALVAVIAASVSLEAVATDLGREWGIPDVVLGGVILAAVTSLPNLVAALYLARRGRGTAMLSEAMNSNRINTLAGLLIPAAIIGGALAAGVGSSAWTLALWYLGMTIGILGVAYVRRGLSRPVGVMVLVVYAAVVWSLIR